MGGNKDFEIRKNTLCHVRGSALEAMFSGRHCLQSSDSRVFIDRDPKAFRMMIDFIRNNGQLYEEQENNLKMLQLELKYWGIDENMFCHRDQIDIIQDILNRPIQNIFDKEEESQFFYE